MHPSLPSCSFGGVVLLACGVANNRGDSIAIFADRVNNSYMITETRPSGFAVSLEGSDYSSVLEEYIDSLFLF